METTIFTVNDLAKRWGKSPQTIRDMVVEKRLMPLKEFKTLNFGLKEVLRVEGSEALDPLSPLERKRLEKTISEQQEEIKDLKSRLLQVANLSGAYLIDYSI